MNRKGRSLPGRLGRFPLYGAFALTGWFLHGWSGVAWWLVLAVSAPLALRGGYLAVVVPYLLIRRKHGKHRTYGQAGVRARGGAGRSSRARARVARYIPGTGTRARRGLTPQGAAWQYAMHGTAQYGSAMASLAAAISYASQRYSGRSPVMTVNGRKVLGIVPAPSGQPYLLAAEVPVANPPRLVPAPGGQHFVLTSGGPVPLVSNKNKPASVPGGSVAALPQPYSSRKPSGPRTGAMQGFDGADFVAGTVRGYRWWTLPGPDLSRPPHEADQHWEPALLHGVMDSWKPGENTAVCKASMRDLDIARVPHVHEVPLEECGCGHWAYWELQHHSGLQGGNLPVCGVAEGYGNVLIGERGFRAGKARIVALHLAFTIQPWAPGTGCRTADILRRHLPDSHVAGDGERLDGPSEDSRDVAWAEAWMAVIGDRLAQTYPGAQVFETREAMLAAFPADPQLPEPEPVRCPGCGDVVAEKETARHAVLCPEFRKLAPRGFSLP